ncbi:hypothetical protein [Bacillus chungangensis]|uniref:Uncharacterized protein n=1 Tax=Bacillus chungangensis TaxID=587633 RepID=A0ABT9WWI1_9BACI|nr:hypothetical protein [Bacillus chungangensis]MDQ0177541.1 hypothetical protein [Bacillus chungangensis]
MKKYLLLFMTGLLMMTSACHFNNTETPDKYGTDVRSNFPSVADNVPLTNTQLIGTEVDKVKEERLYVDACV